MDPKWHKHAMHKANISSVRIACSTEMSTTSDHFFFFEGIYSIKSMNNLTISINRLNKQFIACSFELLTKYKEKC